MAHHLSKENEKWLQSILPKLKSSESAVLLRSRQTQKLLYVLRSAAATDAYSWLRERFIFAKTEAGVLCKPKKLVSKLEEQEEEIETEEILELSLLDLVNFLIQNKPRRILNTSTTFTVTDLESLRAVAKSKDYSIMEHPTYITLTKDEKA